MYEVGAKAYVKNLEFSLREKSAERGFMKSSSHSSTASGILTMHELGRRG